MKGELCLLFCFLSSRCVCAAEDRPFISRCCLWSVLPHYKAGTGAIVASTPSITPCTLVLGLFTSCQDRMSPSPAGRFLPSSLTITRWPFFFLFIYLFIFLAHSCCWAQADSLFIRNIVLYIRHLNLLCYFIPLIRICLLKNCIVSRCPWGAHRKSVRGDRGSPNIKSSLTSGFSIAMET